MSTKTTIKRIALVAAVAAAFGGLSTVAANATADSTNSLSASGTYPVNVTLAYTGSHSNSGAGADSANSTSGSQIVGGYANISFYDTTTASSTATIVGEVSTSGVGSLTNVATTTNTANDAAIKLTGTTGTGATYPTSSVSVVTGSGATTNGSAETITATVVSSVAGTQTITFQGVAANGAPGTAYTATITWLTAANAVSAQYSQIGSNSATSAGPAAWAAANPLVNSTGLTASDSTTTLTPTYIVVAPYDSADHALASEKLTASVSGPGILSVGTVASPGGSGAGRALTGTAGQYEFTLYPDGTAGVSTVTISDGTTTLGTVSVTFTGSASKVTASANLKVLKAGMAASVGGTSLGSEIYSGQLDAADATSILTTSTANVLTATSATSGSGGTAPITAYTTDASGNPVVISASSSIIKVVSSNTAVLTAGSCVNAVGYSVPTINNEINCYVTGTVGAASGSSATATVELWDATTSAWDIVSAPLTFTIGGAVTKEVVSTDATTYSPNQPLKLTVTATDASGNPAYDQDGTAIASIVSSVLASGLASPSYIIGGVGAVKTGIYAPSAEGDFTISGTDGYSVAGEAVSVTATVAGGAASTQAAAATDAANEATDAANAATDAANAAADAADAATQAAQDASAQAQAALAAVNALSAKITVLAAQIAKIVKKIKA